MANLIVLIGDRQVGDPARAPEAPVAIVLGAPVGPDGVMSASLADRVEVGARLYRVGKVQRVLASGGHLERPVPEPDAMRDALVRAGVAPRDIFLDYAGVDTRATMERAAGSFGVTEALVVTQRFHMDRALYLAAEAGIEATGVTANLTDRDLGTHVHDQLRELLSRVKAFGEVTLGAGDDPGEPVPARDGRATWRTRPFVTPAQPRPRG